jgi:DNA-binding NarL/FixJ family response regulator
MALDISMPTKNGVYGAKEILAEFPQTRILIITAVQGNQQNECMKAGAKAIVQKSLHLDDADYVRWLQNSIEKYFENSPDEA